MKLRKGASRVQPAIEAAGVVEAGAVRISRMRINANSRQTMASNRLQKYQQHLSIRQKSRSLSRLNKEAK